jgi:hypothetical protein
MDYCTFDEAHDSEMPGPAAQVTLISVRVERTGGMVKKKKAKRFRAVTAVKELARERVGAPPAGQIVVEKKKKPEKHKPTLGKLLEDE